MENNSQRNQYTSEKTASETMDKTPTNKTPDTFLKN